MKTRRLLAAVAWLLWLVASDAATARATPPAAPREGDQHRRPLPPPVATTIPPSESFYNLRVALTDDSGRRVGLDLWKGHAVLITMVYSSCTSMCPLVIADVKRIDAALSPAARAQTRALLVSMDPVRDTPAALAQLAARHGVDRARFRFVRGSQADTRAIAALLGIRYQTLPNGDLSHTAVITALDGEGRPIAKIEGAGADARVLLAALEHTIR
jgi:protein SCO1/2